MKNTFNAFLHTLIHPTDGFTDYKEKRNYSFLLSVIIVLLLFILRVLERQLTGFYFNNNRPETLNIFFIFIQTIGIFILWVSCNWAIATLSEGEGKMFEIWYFSSISLTPYICSMIINTAISNFLLPSEAMFMFIIRGFGIVWSISILFCGMYVFHDYSVSNIVKNTFFTISFMLIIVFVAVIAMSLFQQVFNFTDAVVREIMSRFN